MRDLREGDGQHRVDLGGQIAEPGAEDQADPRTEIRARPQVRHGRFDLAPDAAQDVPPGQWTGQSSMAASGATGK